MNYTAITDAAVWDSLITRLPNAHALQSRLWGDFKARWGWQAERLAWLTDDGTPQAAAQLLRRSLPGTPWCMLYIPKGPLWDYTNPTLTNQIIADLQTIARQRRALFIKIDPDIPLAFGEPEALEPHPAGQSVKTALQNRGWVYSSQQIQFQNTVLIDLTPSEDDLFAALKPKWRYNIRLAQRKGVTVQSGGVEQLESFFNLYRITSRRDNFLIRPQDYYLDVWAEALQTNRAILLLATGNNQPIAGVMLFLFAQTAWYMYGASDNEQRSLMPNHLLQWHAIQTARQAGCTTYDLWGAPTTFTETDPLWGVYRFKTGFGGITRHGLGAFDYPVNPLLYKIYVQLLPKLIAALRRLKT